jgi:hypothetical protein
MLADNISVFTLTKTTIYDEDCSEHVLLASSTANNPRNVATPVAQSAQQ